MWMREIGRGLSTQTARIGASPYLRLIRLPNLLTAPGDPLAGALWAGGGLGEAVSAMLAAVCLYAGALALNDACDEANDRYEHPGRPIPRGLVSPGGARRVAIGLFAIGIGLAALGGWACGAIAAILTATAVAYNLRLKHSPLGPWAMGACRGQSVLMGAACIEAPGGPALGVVIVAVGMTAYTVALTALAAQETRRERIEQRRWAPSLAALANGCMGLLIGFGLGRVFGGLLGILAAWRAVEPAERWNLASPPRRRAFTGTLVSNIPLLQAAWICAVGGRAAVGGLCWALFAPLHRRWSRRAGTD